MPHKHKRKTLPTSSSSFNLPPSQIAQPLPTSKIPSGTRIHHDTKKRKSKFNPIPTDDDTPRAFARLISGAYRPPRSGLDDGSTRPPSQKRKLTDPPSVSGAVLEQQKSVTSPTSAENTAQPVRLPNESLSAFGARVDATLSLSGIQKAGKGAGARQTKMERRMQRMQKEWRETDRRLKERAKEVDDDVEEDEEDGGDVGLKMGRKGKKKRGEREEDPWAEIARKRKEAEETKGLVGLHDVVTAPPKFAKVNRSGEKIKVGKGGLRREGELMEARRSVVEGYRQMMKEKRVEIG